MRPTCATWLREETAPPPSRWISATFATRYHWCRLRCSSDVKLWVPLVMRLSLRGGRREGETEREREKANTYTPKLTNSGHPPASARCDYRHTPPHCTFFRLLDCLHQLLRIPFTFYPPTLDMVRRVLVPSPVMLGTLMAHLPSMTRIVPSLCCLSPASELL